MEQTPQQDLTIGQAHGDYWKDLIEQHNLIARQVLKQEEASKLLNHSVHQPIPPPLADLLDKVIAAIRRPAPHRPPAATAPAASHSERVTDLSKLSTQKSSTTPNPSSAVTPLALSTPMMFHPASQNPPFSTAESKSLEEARINAIDDYLHGKCRPIANTPAADQARNRRAQLQALATFHRGSRGSSPAPTGDEKARLTEARRRDKALLIDWARNRGMLLTKAPDRYQIHGANDLGGSEHHVFCDDSNRWVKITKGDGTSFGYQPLDEGKANEWMISRERADLASYLEKLALHNQVFHDDIVLHGVIADPVGNVSLIISQPDYQGTYAGTYTAIKPAMEAAGFVRVEPPSARMEEPSAYYRPADNIAVIDLHSENAILEDNGTFLRVFDNIMLQPTGALRATFERLAAGAGRR